MATLGIGRAAASKLALNSLAASSKSTIAFENIIRSSGIQFILDNSTQPQKYQPETMAGGVGVFDYNNDGLLDLYFTNGSHLPEMNKSDPRFHNRLYRNNGDGTFTDVTAQAGVAGSRYSVGVAVADYDNDGYQDLFVTGANGCQLFHNNGNGTFTDVTAHAGLARIHPDLVNSFSPAAGWFDYDNDGFLDLIVINYLKWSPATEPACVSNGVRAYCSPDSYAGLPNLLFHNNGDGTFTDVSEPSGLFKHVGKGMGVAFADYDNDGFVDVFVANDTFRNFLFHNNGNGTFTETGLLSGIAYPENGRSVAGMGVDFRDIDNDGLPDIFETAMYNDNFLLFKNMGKGQFEYATMNSRLGAATRHLTAWGTGIFDFDNDGWKDIFTSNAAILDNSEEVSHTPYFLANSLFANNRDGTFTDVAALAGPSFGVPAAHRGAAFGDLNNDGRIDIVTNCLNGKPEILMNRSAPSNHWLLINLVGTVSNRDGLGSRIKITAKEGVQYNHATTSVGYGSSSDKRVHFGLGAANKVDQLEVTWPSGIKQTVANVAADQILTLREPASK
ncbi:MAG TPA: CRTAC1 family protein [Candidatus Sulfotelmatobacter sp.]|nr:CRTAC1 family protein [Candidatus Sulfotelmatobacter sp.]